MKAWIVEFDNGYDYEDHDTQIIVVALSEATAQKMQARLTKWIASKRKAVPPEPDGELSDGEYCKEHDKRQAWLNNLVPPYGEKCLVKAINNESGFIRVYEVRATP